MTQSKEVIKNIIPKSNFKNGTKGLVYAYFSYKLNRLYSSSSAKYLALNSVNFLLTYRPPFHLSKNPA